MSILFIIIINMKLRQRRNTDHHNISTTNKDNKHISSILKHNVLVMIIILNMKVLILKGENEIQKHS